MKSCKRFPILGMFAALKKTQTLKYWRKHLTCLKHGLSMGNNGRDAAPNVQGNISNVTYAKPAHHRKQCRRRDAHRSVFTILWFWLIGESHSCTYCAATEGSVLVKIMGSCACRRFWLARSNIFTALKHHKIFYHYTQKVISWDLSGGLICQ